MNLKIIHFEREAYDRGTNDYYEKHPVPEGFKKEEIILTEEALNRAVTRTLKEMFELGMFENPYRDPKKAIEVVADQRIGSMPKRHTERALSCLKMTEYCRYAKKSSKRKKFMWNVFTKTPGQRHRPRKN